MAWVTLDERDNDDVVLWSHVIEALGRSCPALGEAVPPAMVAAAPLLEVVLPRLVNALVELDELALVLDDFHRLSSGAARGSVAWFVDHLPTSLQLVVASRMDPSLPLGTLRAHGQLLELRADELRFTEAEAERFLNGLLALDLEPADVALLVARTEGWPAGLYLAALSLAGKADKRALVRAFDGTSAHVVDFLAGEVLAGYDPDLQTFMLRTSVLERLCAELCDAVLGQDTSGRALESLARTNLFLVPLDTTGGGSGSTTCSRRSCASSWSDASRARAGAAPSRVRMAPRVRDNRRGRPACARRGRVRRGEPADHGDVGPLRQRRPDSLRPGLADAVPEGGARRATGGSCS